MCYGELLPPITIALCKWCVVGPLCCCLRCATKYPPLPFPMCCHILNYCSNYVICVMVTYYHHPSPYVGVRTPFQLFYFILNVSFLKIKILVFFHSFPFFLPFSFYFYFFSFSFSFWIFFSKRFMFWLFYHNFVVFSAIIFKKITTRNHNFPKG